MDGLSLAFESYSNWSYLEKYIGVDDGRDFVQFQQPSCRFIYVDDNSFISNNNVTGVKAKNGMNIRALRKEVAYLLSVSDFYYEQVN
jgi:hypothetical protein